MTPPPRPGPGRGAKRRDRAMEGMNGYRNDNHSWRYWFYGFPVAAGRMASRVSVAEVPPRGLDWCDASRNRDQDSRKTVIRSDPDLGQSGCSADFKLILGRGRSRAPLASGPCCSGSVLSCQRVLRCRCSGGSPGPRKSSLTERGSSSGGGLSRAGASSPVAVRAGDGSPAGAFGCGRGFSGRLGSSGKPVPRWGTPLCQQ